MIQNHKKNQSLKYSAIIFLVGIFVFGLRVTMTRAFTEPSTSWPFYTTNYYSATPSALFVGQIPEFLNSSAADQRKFGSLVIGQQGGGCTIATGVGCSRLCLNADTQGAGSSNPITTDATNCKYSWSQVQVSAGSLLTLYDSSIGANADRGYIAIQAKPVAAGQLDGQLISLIAEAPTGIAGATPPTGIAADGIVTSKFSAQFAGTVAVVGSGGNGPQLCLNTKNSVEDCISSWTQTIQDTTIVALQTMTTETTRTADTGNVSSGGVFVGGSLVSGMPVSTTQRAVSCGDGICSAPYESSASSSPNYCSQDCP